MSELKEIDMIVNDDYKTKVYIKSEADKVIADLKKNAIRQYVDEILSTPTSVYLGCRKPRWIRQKTDAKAGDTVTVNGIEQRYKDKPYPHYEEGCAVISHKRVYNGTLLFFDGKEWIQIDGGKIR